MLFRSIEKFVNVCHVWLALVVSARTCIAKEMIIASNAAANVLVAGNVGLFRLLVIIWSGRTYQVAYQIQGQDLAAGLPGQLARSWAMRALMKFPSMEEYKAKAKAEIMKTETTGHLRFHL